MSSPSWLYENSTRTHTHTLNSKENKNVSPQKSLAFHSYFREITYMELSDWIMLLIQLLSYELTARVLPCLETAAWYFFIFSFVDVDSNTLSDTDRPTAEEINIFNVLTLNSHENCGCISPKQQMITLQFKSTIHYLDLQTTVSPETTLPTNKHA